MKESMNKLERNKFPPSYPLLKTSFFLVTQRTARGDSVLHIAATTGHYYMFEFLLGLDTVKPLVSATNSKGQQPIHLAAKEV